jgi:hypothetical protein
MIAPIVILLACAAVAQSQPKSVEKANKSQDAKPVTDEQTRRDIRAISDELKAIREQAARYEEARAKQKQSWWTDGGPPVWSNWAVTIVAGLAGFVAWMAFRSERQAVRLTQRADVLIEGVNVSSYPNPILPGTTIDIVLKNYGATRASNVKVQVFVGIDENECAPPPEHSFVLGAKARQPVGVSVARCMRPETFLKVRTGEVTLRFWGAIGYDDVFGDAHSTKVSGTFFKDDCFFGVDSKQGD